MKLLSVLFPILILMSPFARCETGVTDTEIRLGMSNALSGPASGLGNGIKKGSNVVFDKINAAGGIHGRKIRLISEDDGYEPTRSYMATEKLLKQDQVFALYGYVGTPTSKAVLPLISRHEVPFFAPFTGADFLRTPVDPWIFNVRASYREEADLQVQHLVKVAKIARIGMFIQGDAFGLAGSDEIKRAMDKFQMTPVAEGRYQRNTDNIDGALLSLMQGKPDAVIMVGTYPACAALVKKAASIGFHPRFLSLSFIGTNDFIEASGTDGENVMISQVMPSPYDTSLPIIKQYQADLRQAGITTFDYTTLEGYINAKVLVTALKEAGPNLTRQSFRAALEQLRLNLGGFDLAFSAQNHQGSSRVYLTQIKGGKVLPSPKAR